MQQMYKVFTKDKCIFLLEDETFFKPDESPPMRYASKKLLHDTIKQFEANNKVKNLYVLHENINELWADFTSLFKIIEAAGGVVRNSENHILFIVRHEKWDLPKGKIELGEQTREAAIREVKEECGIKNELTVIKELPPTYHIYVQNGERILKKTYWFEMVNRGEELLIPQAEENITDVKWLDAEGVKEAMKNTYPSIMEVVKALSR